ncbi:hypothetical protein M0813_15100 [Anaeramoeba flamelloides]|uniref:Alpha-type protein kinase domain-containing protein n=1 Tax=Anaeramoeba flamelloides TaxID=1746091 RepID=A0ABQ8Z3G6_9EUKA|nr:hypothetical protein M0813_15100 [Anaeramoeba flamelloides]
MNETKKQIENQEEIQKIDKKLLEQNKREIQKILETLELEGDQEIKVRLTKNKPEKKPFLLKKFTFDNVPKTNKNKLRIGSRLKKKRDESQPKFPSWKSDQMTHKICVVLDYEEEEKIIELNTRIINKIKFFLCYLNSILKFQISIISNVTTNPFRQLTFESIQKNEITNIYQEIEPQTRYTNFRCKTNKQKGMSNESSSFILHFLSNRIDYDKQNERVLRDNQVYCENNHIQYLKIHSRTNLKNRNNNNSELKNYFSFGSKKHHNNATNKEYQIVNKIINELRNNHTYQFRTKKYQELKELKPYPPLMDYRNWGNTEEVQIITHVAFDIDQIFTNLSNHKEFTFTQSKVKIYSKALMLKDKYDAFPFADIQVSIPLIAKVYHKFMQDSFAQYLNYIYAEAILQSYIQNFNDLISNKWNKTVQLSPKILYSFPRRKTDRFYIVEPFYPNDNAFRKYLPKEDKLLNTFSHYVLAKSKKRMCIEIISAVDNKIKRYKLHSKQYLFSDLDSGENKIFFINTNHRCNRYCKKLKLNQEH